MCDMDNVIINLKACLISTKTGIPLNQLESEYFKLNGERIPFKDLGCSSLEVLLNSSGKFTIFNDKGVKTVKAKATDKTQHLTDLIKKQKSKPPKKKSSGSKIGFKRFNISNLSNRLTSHSSLGSSNVALKNNYFSRSTATNCSSNHYKKPTPYNSRPTQHNSYQQKINRHNDYKPQPSLTTYGSNTNINRENRQSNSDCYLTENKNYHPIIKQSNYKPSLTKYDSDTNINLANHQSNSDNHLAENKPARFDYRRSRLFLTALKESNLFIDKSTTDVKSTPIVNVLKNSNLLNDKSKSDFKSIPISYNALTESNIFNGKGKNDVKSVTTNVLTESNVFNGKSKNDIKSIPLTNAPKESNTFNDKSQNDVKSSSITNLHKFQNNNKVSNNSSSNMFCTKHEDIIPKNNFYEQSVKPCTAQSRLNKYPKKYDEVVGIEKQQLSLEELRTANLKISVDSSVKIPDDKDYVDELESLLRNLNLPEPYYDYMVKKEKFGQSIKRNQICVIKVNEKKVSSSLPVECGTEEYSKKIAAKHALNIFKRQYGENVIYPITSDINVIASRIKEFLKLKSEHEGLEKNVLENMYRGKFLENLPEHWFQLLEVYNYFIIKTISNKIVLYLNETTNTHNIEDHMDQNECLEVPIVEPDIVPGTPSTLEGYEEKSVLVSANYGPTSVWIRLVGQNADENFIQMQAKFNDFMNTTGFNVAEQIIEGEFYAVLYNTSWHRVQICEPTEEDGSVTCFMVDTGEQLNISKDQICCLEPVFMKTKTQAIECILTQLDNFSAFDGLKELLDEMILNKTFFLILNSFEKGYARITLYEKGEGSDRINVNELIIQRLLEKSINRLPSFEENAIVDGNVSAIVETGYLYLQLNFDIVSSLEEILPNEECLLPDYFLKSKEDVNKDQVYLAKYYDGDNVIWCRAQVLEIINDIEVEIIFIDYGNHAKCKIIELVNLELFDPLMAKIPPQAIKVYMNLLPPKFMNAEITEKIFAIIGNEKVLVNLVNAPLNDVPCIQLYKIQPVSEETICINIMLVQSLKNH